MKHPFALPSCLLLGFLLCIQGSCWAATSFYVASVGVASQSPEERAKAAAVGLQEILWRVTGSKITEQTPGLAGVFKQPETYLDSFQYAAGTDNNPQQVVLQFSPQSILQLTQTYHLAFWPENRPKVLVWLVQSQAGQPDSFIRDANDTTVKKLQEAAKLRGLTLAFPNWDADDLAALRPAQLISGDKEALMNASFRYSLDTLLVGALNDTTSRWRLDHRGEQQTLTDVDPAVGLHTMADMLARTYALGKATGGNTSSTAVIAVEVRDFLTYYNLMNYLTRQAQVASAKLIEAQPQRLIVELSLRGNLPQFDKGLSLDRQLEPLAPNSGDIGTRENPVPYRWLSK